MQFYNLPSVKSNRSAGFGYSTKYDFTKISQKNPAPNNYSIKSEIDFNKEKFKGKSFGVSRDVY